MGGCVRQNPAARIVAAIPQGIRLHASGSRTPRPGNEGQIFSLVFTSGSRTPRPGLPNFGHTPDARPGKLVARFSATTVGGEKCAATSPQFGGDPCRPFASRYFRPATGRLPAPSESRLFGPHALNPPTLPLAICVSFRLRPVDSLISARRIVGLYRVICVDDLTALESRSGTSERKTPPHPVGISPRAGDIIGF